MIALSELAKVEVPGRSGLVSGSLRVPRLDQPRQQLHILSTRQMTRQSGKFLGKISEPDRFVDALAVAHLSHRLLQQNGALCN